MTHLLRKGSILTIDYGQVLLYDSAILPGNRWTSNHFVQGFSRRKHCLSFLTLFDEDGLAWLKIYDGRPVDIGGYTRVIRCPLSVPSLRMRIQGPTSDYLEIKVTSEWQEITFCQAGALAYSEAQEALLIELFSSSVDWKALFGHQWGVFLGPEWEKCTLEDVIANRAFREIDWIDLDVYVEASDSSTTNSEILKLDERLNPPSPLVEDCAPSQGE